MFIERKSKVNMNFVQHAEKQKLDQLLTDLGIKNNYSEDQILESLENSNFDNEKALDYLLNIE